MASDKDKEDKAAGSSNGGSCGAVFARWLVAVQEGEAKGREIELVVGGEEEEEEEDNERRMSYRRHVFEEIEFNEEKLEGGNENLQEEEARVSICIPPKNALLLMRCRSDPVRMAALANKFWEAPAPQVDDEEEEEEEEEDEDDVNKEKEKGNVEEVGASEEKHEHKEDLMCEKLVSFETIEDHQIEETEASLVILEAEDGEDCQERSTDIDGVQEGNLVEQEDEAEIEVMNQTVSTQEISLSTTASPNEEIADAEASINHVNEDKILLQEHEDTQEDSLGEEEGEQEEDNPQEDTIDDIHDITSVPLKQEQESEKVGQDFLQDQEAETEPAESPAVAELAVQESNEEKETTEKTWKSGEEEEKTMTHETSEPDDPKSQQGQTTFNLRDRDSQQLKSDCLLLMMCEPTLSMEAS